MPDAQTDYVVVGAGSSGAVVASRLTQDPSVDVVLLEAGGPADGDAVKIPAAFASTFKTRQDWAYVTGEQEHAGGRAMYWPRGKMLGGCSSMNAMIYIRGHREDYDSWDRAGCEGWSYDQVLPYFVRSEHNERGASAYHGTGGPQNVADPRHVHPQSAAFIEAAAQHGWPRNDDFNGAEQAGVGTYQLTQKKGSRFSVADGFLTPAMKRPNLHVETHALATRVLFEDSRAVGVEYRQAGRTQVVRARKEVVLSGGTVNTPQLLMLSGLGAAHHLREHGLDVVVDAPAVGQNLQDHPLVSVAYRSTSEDSLMNATSPKELAKFLLRGRGMLTSNVAEAGGFGHSGPGLVAPDLQWIFAPVEFEQHGMVDPTNHLLTFAVYLLTPESRGQVTLASSDPAWAPVIEPNYLEAETDLERLVSGLRQLQQVARQPALRRHLGEPFLPSSDELSDDELRDHVRRRVETVYHPVGTCRMGSDQTSVVDPQLRVRGVRGLRVADCSVLPTVPRGNTNAPAIMVGEKAADLLVGRPAPAPVAGLRR